FAAAQYELRQLWRTVETQRLQPRKPSADVQHGRRQVKRTGTVAHAVAAGRQDRTDGRKADLPTVRVPGQHQVHVVLLSPAELVRRVRQRDAKLLPRRGRQTVRHAARRLNPRQLVAGEKDFLPSDGVTEPSAGQINQPAIDK